MLNLLKSKESRPRETLLRREYATAINMLNSHTRDHGAIVYMAWDMSKFKNSGANVLLEMSTLNKLALELTGLYVQHSVAASDTAALEEEEAAAGEIMGADDAPADLEPLNSSPVDFPAHPASQAASRPPSEGGRVQRAAAAAGVRRRSGTHQKLQNGVLRTNCIDCLDR